MNKLFESSKHVCNLDMCPNAPAFHCNEHILGFRGCQRNVCFDHSRAIREIQYVIRQGDLEAGETASSHPVVPSDHLDLNGYTKVEVDLHRSCTECFEHMNKEYERKLKRERRLLFLFLFVLLGAVFYYVSLQCYAIINYDDLSP